MTLSLIPITAIRANPDQPRKNFDADALRELANSIRATGLQQPITLRPTARASSPISWRQCARRSK